MRLKAIRVAEVGPFRQGVAVEGLSGTLDVLTAPNEAGKSTLFRAVNLLFTFPHTAMRQEIKALQADGTGAPLIEVDFELAGRAWRLAKRFVAQRFARLTDLGSGAILRGADAESRLSELMAASGRKTLLGLLWVDQGTGFKLPEPGQDAVTTLRAAIDAEISAAAGSGLARGVRQLVRQRCSELLTQNTRKPKKGSEYGRALEEVEQLRERHRVATQQAVAVEERLASLGRLREEEAQLAAPQRAAAQAERVEQARRARAAADEATRRQAAAALKVTAAQAHHDRAMQALDAVQAGLDEHRRLLDELARLEVQAVAFASARDEAAGRLSETTHALRLTRESVDALHEERRRIERSVHLIQLRDHLARMRTQLDQARKAEGRLAGLDDEIRRLEIDQHGLGQARRIAAEIAALEARIAAGAARVRLVLDPLAAAAVSVDGAGVQACQEIMVDRPVVITIAGIGTVEVLPAGGSGAAEARAKADRLVAERDQLIGRLGVGSLADGEARLTACAALRTQRSTNAAMLSALAPDGVSALVAEEQRLALRLEGAADKQELAAALAARSQDADERLSSAQSALSRHEEAERAARSRLAEAEQRSAQSRARFDNIRQRLQELDAKVPPVAERPQRLAALRAEVERATAALNEAAREHTAWRDAVPAAAALAALDRELAAAERDRAHTMARLTEVRHEIAGIEGGLQRDAEIGIGAQPGEIEVDLEAAEARAGRFRDEAETLLLLDRVLEEVETGDQERILIPVRQRMDFYAAHLFPGAAIGWNAALGVRDIGRGGQIHNMERLSTGTLEQIAILARLAYARLLAEQNVRVPVILDDVLVFADDLRLERMFDVLSLAAQRHQVVVLSCHETQFRALGQRSDATTLTFQPWKGS